MSHTHTTWTCLITLVLTLTSALPAVAIDIYDNVSGTTNLAALLLDESVRNAAYHDINGDGLGDLIVTYSDDPGEAFQGSANFGDPRFSSTVWSNLWETNGQPAEGACGILFADYDNDGDLDFYVPNPTGHQLFKYDETQNKYVDVTAAMGLQFTGGDAIYNNTINAAWGDFDGDSYVDLLILQSTDDTNETLGSDHQKLLKNNAGIGFYDSNLCNSGAGVGFSGSTRIVSAHWVDFDVDNDLDLVLIQGKYSSGTAQTSKYLENDNQNGEYFHNQSSKIAACMTQFDHITNCTAPADMDNDGRMDLVFNNAAHYGIFLAGSDGTLSAGWESRFPAAPHPRIWDVAAFDADLDGTNDMLVSQFYYDDKQPTLYLGCWDNGEPRFDDVPPETPACGNQVFQADDAANYLQYGLCAADFVQNGQTEFYMSRPFDDVNEGEFFWDIDSDPGNWIGFDLSAPHGMCNRAMIGTTAIINYDDGVDSHTQAKMVDGGSGRASQSDLRLQYGLGDITDPVDLRVHLTNKGVVSGGQTLYLNQVPIGQYWDFEVDGLVDSSVSTSITHDLATGKLTLTVTWETYDTTTVADDQLTFYVDEFPDAYDPGQRFHYGGAPLVTLANGRYQHSMSISGLDCDTSLKFYFSLQGRSGTTLHGSSIHARGPKKCIVQDPPPYVPGIQ